MLYVIGAIIFHLFFLFLLVRRVGSANMNMFSFVRGNPVQTRNFWHISDIIKVLVLVLIWAALGYLVHS